MLAWMMSYQAGIPAVIYWNYRVKIAVNKHIVLINKFLLILLNSYFIYKMVLDKTYLPYYKMYHAYCRKVNSKPIFPPNTYGYI